MVSIETVPRRDFTRSFGEDYRPAHLTMIGPSQRGKSTLSGQLLREVVTRDNGIKAVLLHGKILKRDPVIPKLAKACNFRIVHTWPPPLPHRPSERKRAVNGWILLPLKVPGENGASEDATLKREFEKALRENYHNTKSVRITVVDERAQADKDLHMTKDLDAPLQRGLPDNPEWNNIQRGAWISYHCYNAPEHIFIFHDDHESNRKRYSEFGCADPDELFYLASNLSTHRVKTGGTISQCLYLRRSDRYMCIVDT